MNNNVNPPYRGKLLDLLPDEANRARLKQIAGNLVQIALGERSILDFELIANGGLSPLDRFMNQKDYEMVLEKMETSENVFWPIPVCLDIDEKTYEAVKNQNQAALTDQEGFQLAIIEIDDIYEPDKSREALKIFGTDNIDHPGVKYLKNKINKYYLGGKIQVIELPVNYDFKALRFTPKELRGNFIKSGWQSVAAFQTRHPLHRLQFELCLDIIKEHKKKLLINQIAGETEPGDFDRFTRIRATNRILDKFPVNSTKLNIVPLYIRFAGYKDALLHSIISKNYGCSDFIVGHGHSNPFKKDRIDYFYDNEIIKKKLWIFQKKSELILFQFQK